MKHNVVALPVAVILVGFVLAVVVVVVTADYVLRGWHWRKGGKP